MTAHPKPSVTQAASTYEAQDEAVAFRWWTDWRNCEGEELALKCAFARHRQSAEAASRAEVERLREALEPFIRDWRDAGVPDSIDDKRAMISVDDGHGMTVGDWRRLASAYAALSASDGEG